MAEPRSNSPRPAPASSPVAGKVVAVTGGGSGIGEGLARRFAAEGARHIAVLDIDLPAARKVAADIGGQAIETDVGSRRQAHQALRQITAAAGEIDIFCSNAGIGIPGGLETRQQDWQRNWQINTLAHVYFAQQLMPQMSARDSGAFIITASAAGLLTEMNSLAYSVVKHGAVAVADWLAITYGSDGVQVSVLCPQGVRTKMFPQDVAVAAGQDGTLMPADVADVVMQALADGRFLILPHPQVEKYVRNKTDDPQRWHAGMRKLKARLAGGDPAGGDHAGGSGHAPGTN